MASIAHAHTMASQAWAHGRYHGLCWGRMGPQARLQHLCCQWRHTWLESKSWTCQDWLQQLSDLTHLGSEFHLRTCRHNDQHGISHVSNRHSYSYREEKAPTRQPTVAIDIATSSIVVVIVATMAAMAFATSMAAMPAELLLMPASTGTVAAVATAAAVTTVPTVATKATASFLVAPVAQAKPTFSPQLVWSSFYAACRWWWWRRRGSTQLIANRQHLVYQPELFHQLRWQHFQQKQLPNST